jgi:glutaminyl-peptide cyclotransferase
MAKMSPRGPRGFRRPALLAAVVLTAGGVAVAAWALLDHVSNGHAAEAKSALKLESIPFDGARAYESLKQLCAIGPRPSGSPGMEAQQKLLEEHFRKLGGQVELQTFRVPHPQNGSAVPMTNIIVHWQPESTNRILLCAHYDTLPFPMEDKENPQGTFIGANDNASGVAILMEMAHNMPSLKCKYGVDFLFLDGEEFRFSRNDRFFLGSDYFARNYAKNKPHYHYRWGVLLDMVGDADLQIGQEGNSLWWKDTRPLVEQIWAVAAKLGVREFLPKKLYDIEDDHLRLHNEGHIPCIDVIDMDYPPWHTEGDTPDKCSPLSLAKVGWVIEEWLKTAK